MFKSKSFNLITEEDIKKSESSKKYGWMRCLILPALIAFILTLILLNVDFSGAQTEKSTTQGLLSTFVTDASIITEPIPNNDADDTLGIEVEKKSMDTLESIEDVSAKMESFTESKDVHNESSQLRNGFGDFCTEKANPCTLSCSGSYDDRSLNKRLEDQYKKCQNDMELTLQGFIIRTLGKSFLSGNFRLKKLHFFNCILDMINNYGFNKPSLKNLQKLIITDSSVTKMSSLTFEGLESLQHFEMINRESLYALDAKQFLAPMTETLTRLIFKHSSPTKTYDPTPWLDGENFVKLTDVDLSDNNFPDTLHKITFTKLVGVKNLNLKNCRITHIGENTFLKVKETLQKLDLSRNLFKTLNTDFLLSMSGTDITISLSNNIWDCSCHSDVFVENIKNTKIIFEQEPKCSTPPHLTGVEIKEVICCEEKCEEKTTRISNTESEIVTVTTTTEKVSISTKIPNKTTPTTKLPDRSEEFNGIELVCKSSIDDSKFTISIKEQYVAYTIRGISPTSIAVELKALRKKFQLLFFGHQLIKTIEISERVTLINDLIARQEYIFCALPPKGQSFSPFNCRSHYTGLNLNRREEVWLKNRHMPLFMSLATFGAVVFLFIGALMIYFLLRWRPTLLKGSKRLLRFDTVCKQVFLSKENTALSTEDLYEALRTYATFNNKPTHNLANNDYLQYIRGIDTTNTIYAGIHFSENLPPAERAPAKPPIGIKRPLSQQSTIPANDASSLESISESTDEHEYQYLDQYPQIY